METCQRPAVDPDRELDPAEATWLVVGRDPALARVVATLPVDPAVHGPGAEAWPVAARDLAVGPRQVIWGTFLICQAAVEAERIVPAQEPLQVVPQRSPPVVLRPISCMTDRQRNPARALEHAQVPATLLPTFHVPALAVVAFNDPRLFPARMVVAFNDPRLVQDKTVVESSDPRLDRVRTAAEFNGPRLDRARTAAESNGPRLVPARMAAEFNVPFAQMAAIDPFDRATVHGQAARDKAAVVRNGNRAIGQIIGPTISMIGTSGTIGAKTTSLRSTTTSATTGAISTVGMTAIGGTITGTLISIGIRTSIGGAGRRLAP
jgi:hypothetical protein